MGSSIQTSPHLFSATHCNMASNGILNDDLAQQLDDLSSDSETEYEADFRINALVKRAIRPDSQMFLLPEVSQSDLQLAAEAREAYYFVVNTTPTLFHNFVRDFYRVYIAFVQRGTDSLPIFVWLYNWIRYLVGVMFSAVTELSFAYQIIIQSHYQLMLKLDQVVTSVFDDRQNSMATGGLSVMSIHSAIPQRGGGAQPRTGSTPPSTPWEMKCPQECL